MLAQSLFSLAYMDVLVVLPVKLSGKITELPVIDVTFKYSLPPTSFATLMTSPCLRSDSGFCPLASVNVLSPDEIVALPM